MAQPIPPLLCNTPPPIDFGDGHDEDFEDFEAAKTEYEGVSLSVSPQLQMKNLEENLDLPPLPNDHAYSMYSENVSGFKYIEEIQNEEVKDVKENIEKSNESLTEIKETLKDPSTFEKNTEMKKEEEQLRERELDAQELKTECAGKISREDSPQSLELYTNNLSEDENDSIGEFQAANEVNYDDNTSLPSLKFDSIGVSKTVTPIFDDKSLQAKGSDESYKKENSIFSALQSTPSQSDVESADFQIQAIDTIPDNTFPLERQEENEIPTEDLFMHVKQQCATDKEVLYSSKVGEAEAVSKAQVQKNDTTEENETNPEHNFDEFEADFSQFESCNVCSLPSDNQESNKMDSIQIIHTEKLENIERISEVDEDFEEFQDFRAAKIQKNDNEDDFGEFNNFEASNSDYGTLNSFKLINLDEQVKPILDSMFPMMNDSSLDLEKAESKIDDSNSQYMNYLGEIDSAKALDYQWTNSNIKQSLIKSLGIDSRNILYGEKWNSSLPRFAANLVFNPLEPLKPVKVGNGSRNHLLLPSHQSKKLENPPNTSTRGNIPEVEFDWNSSGLVNPLDASHAHTLLLDLDQLVVVANLDKINLDSSSPCATATLETNNCLNTGKNFVPINLLPVTNHQLGKRNILMDYINDAYTNDCNGDIVKNALVTDVKCFNGNGIIGDGSNHCNKRTICTSVTATNITNSIVANATAYITNSHHGFDNDFHNDIFDQYLDFRIKKIVRERKTETVHPPESGGLDESIDQHATEEAIANIKSTNTTASFSSINIDLTNEILEKTDDITNPPVPNQASDNVSSADVRSPSVPATFVYPLKETHIFTPTKIEPNYLHNTKTDDKDPIDFDFKVAAAGIIIDEKVVKKEYRDIEYNPSNWNFGSLPETNIDSVCGSLHESKDKSVGNSSNTMFSESIPAISADLKENNEVSNLSDDFSEFHFKLSEKKPKSTCAVTVDNTLETIKSPFQTTTQVDGIKMFDMFVENIKKETESGNLKANNSVDDDFTEFQSVPPSILNTNKAISNQKLNKSIVEEKSKSRTETPTFGDEMILSPAVLLPQAIKIDRGPKIEWPEPGINLEELARIEELFPQQKNDKFRGPSSGNNASTEVNVNVNDDDDDDDWSEFVSVPAVMNQTNLPPSQGLNSTVHTVSNDDEWSDFVSGTPAQWNSAHNFASPQIPNAWNQSIKTTGNTFHSYLSQQNQQMQLKNNVPTKFYQGKSINNNISQYLLHSNSVISDHHHHQPNQFLPPQHQDQSQQQINVMMSHQRNQNIIKSQLNQAPSISLIPDLGFVAPRNLINIPRSTIPKK